MDHLVAIDLLDDLVHNARYVPLTDQVMVRRDELESAVGQVRDLLPADLRRRAEADGLLERLETLVRNAKPMPLGSTVRVDKGELYEILDRIRGLVAPPGR